jgi:tricorn protease
MIAELTVQHAYIEGGDFEMPPRPRVALPGARFELDERRRPLPHREDLRGPQRGADLPLAAHRGRRRRRGRRLRAGHRRRGAARRRQPVPPAAHKADRPVTLTVNAKPTLDGARR